MPFLFWATLPFAMMDMWFRECERPRDRHSQVSTVVVSAPAMGAPRLPSTEGPPPAGLSAVRPLVIALRVPL